MRDESPGLPLPPALPARTWDWRLALASFLGLSLICGILAAVVPKFAEVFEQVKVSMGSSIETILALSRGVREDVRLLPIGIVVFSIQTGTWTGRRAAIARVLIPVLTILVSGWIVVSLFSPFLSLAPGLGQRHR
ncbi:MAG TPA: hypothetical protein VE981_09565 [Planctomycetota bacterium]|nr:hypothetical protein [Planctomycetota bacterium]